VHFGRRRNRLHQPLSQGIVGRRRSLFSSRVPMMPSWPKEPATAAVSSCPKNYDYGTLLLGDENILNSEDGVGLSHRLDCSRCPCYRYRFITPLVPAVDKQDVGALHMPMLNDGRLVVDPDLRTVRMDGQYVRLSPVGGCRDS
jgi:hypothetical protein